ncbi:MAG: hypothetical protein AAB483_01595 [Patescibacteria group bacterium]
MDFTKLKEIAKRLGGILIMQGNEPELVILSYEKFSALETPISPAGGPPAHEHPTHTDLIASQNSKREEELMDTLNKEILALKEEIRQKETAELA